MKQLPSQKFVSEDQKIVLLCDNDTALGDLHDFLMAAKGMVVDRMIEAHKQDQEAAKTQKQQEHSE